jgi:RNA polymerase sigma-70 factor, ECF subfamily
MTGKGNEPIGRRGRLSGMPTSVADESLLRTLYDDHASALLGYVLRLVSGDRHRAEDVVQETLYRAWQHPDALAPERGSVRPWLWTVARRIVLDGERARRARPREVADVDFPLGAVDDGVDRALAAQVVTDALASLTPEHRAALIETYYRGRSVAEAAATLGVPEGTVKSRTYYALRNLRSALEERGFGATEAGL